MIRECKASNVDEILQPVQVRMSQELVDEKLKQIREISSNRLMKENFILIQRNMKIIPVDIGMLTGSHSITIIRELEIRLCT